MFTQAPSSRDDPLSQGNPFSLLATGMLTGVALLYCLWSVITLPSEGHWVALTIYALLTTLALLLSVPIGRTQHLSIAHAIGLIALFSLDADVIPAMTLAIFIGGLLGGLLCTQLRREASTLLSLHLAIRVTLSYFVAAWLYSRVFHGHLPLSRGFDHNQHLGALLLTVMVYLLVYLLTFLIQILPTTRLRRFLGQQGIALALLLIVPVPFALITAGMADDSSFYFALTVIGAILILVGLFISARSEQRLRRQLEEMTSLSIATQAMRSNLALDALLRTIYVQVSQLLNAENFTVMLLDEIDLTPTFPLVIRDGEEIGKPITTTQDMALIQHMMATEQALCIRADVETFAHERNITLNAPIPSSWMGAPLMVGDELIGAFVLFDTHKRHFDGDDLRALNIIAASTSIAIENVRLYRHKSKRAEQLATLNRVTALFTATLAPNEVLDVLVSSASTIAESNAVAIYLVLDNEDDPLQLTRSAGLSDAFLEKPPAPLLAQVVKHHDDILYDYESPRSLLIASLDDERLSEPLRQVLQREGKQAFIEHPLSFNGNHQGVIALYYDSPQVYLAEQVNLIQAFATQAAQAINNAHLFASADQALEQRVEQLYVLAAMGRLLSASMEARKIYQIVLTYATDATRTPRGFVALYRSDGHIRVLSQRGYPDDTFAEPDYLMQGLSGKVLHSGQAIRVTDTRLETSYLPIVPQTRSLIVTPIMKGRDILGIIMLESDRPHHFSEGDGHFVAQIANQAVIAVDNTRLFQRVREARDNMQVILDAMQEGIILVDERATIALANPHIRLLDLHPSDLLGQFIPALLKDEGLQFAQRLGFSNARAFLNVLEYINSDWQSQALHHYEIRGDSFGTRYIQRQIIPVRDERQRVSGIMLVFYDKSEERELAIARESLSQMIVHDLRSPLTAVTTSLRLLQKLVPADADFAPLVETTTTASRRAIRKVLTRVDSLLDVSKMESGNMTLTREASAIQAIVDNVQTELKPLADELDVTITKCVADDIPLLSIDTDKVERLVLNLVDNALKYSPSQALVTIGVTEESSRYARLSVMDQGPGIPDDDKQRLFERYAQVKGRSVVRRGVGLGLTFCKLVAEAHGGTIWVDDNPDGGSIFNVTLPIHES